MLLPVVQRMRTAITEVDPWSTFVDKRLGLKVKTIEYTSDHVVCHNSASGQPLSFRWTLSRSPEKSIPDLMTRCVLCV